MARISSSIANPKLPYFATLLVALPWLNPFAPGPAPAVVPLLLSWVCAALLLGMSGLPALRAQREHYVAAVVHAWLVAALLSALVGLLQYFGLTQAWGPWVSAGTMGEAFANLRQRNQFATLTSIGLVALLWQVAQTSARAPSVTRAFQWLMWGAAALLLAAGNAASSSRTGLFQWLLLAGLVLLWWREMRAQRAVSAPSVIVGLGALGLYCAAVLVLPVLLEWTTGFQSAGLMGRINEQVGCQSRRVLWSNVLHLIAQKPWLGWGWGELGYAHFVTLYPGDRFCDILDNAHNLPLHLAVELGVPLALAACGALLWMVLRAKPWRESDATRQLAWGVLAMIGLHSLLEYPLWYGPFQMAVVLASCLLWRTQPEEQVRYSHLALVFTGICAIIFVAILVFTAWDYWRVSQLYVVPADRAEAYRHGTLDKVRNSWMFQNQVRFAELTTATLSSDNASQLHTLASQLLHFSPEPRVVEKCIESAVLLGLDREATFYLVRYKDVFPREHAQWAGKALVEGAL